MMMARIGQGMQTGMIDRQPCMYTDTERERERERERDAHTHWHTHTYTKHTYTHTHTYKQLALATVISTPLSPVLLVIDASPRGRMSPSCSKYCKKSSSKGMNLVLSSRFEKRVCQQVGVQTSCSALPMWLGIWVGLFFLCSCDSGGVVKWLMTTCWLCIRSGDGRD